ncbi:MAG TPA: PAS domain S-box protein, partial [Desulfosarcina sp.]|nr:PAS domain S-box protein [Desulfosarcina sp.]
RSLLLKLLVCVGGLLLLSLGVWGVFNFRYMQKKMIDNITAGTQRLSNTIRLGTHYAMMINSRDDIKQIITNVSKQHDIVNIRIYNKQGEIKFSNRDAEIDTVTNIKDEACYICHRTDPPVYQVTLAETVRTFRAPGGYRLMGVISPVYNEPGCSTDACHVHPPDKKVLGAIDLVVSLEEADKELARYERNLVALAVFIFLATSAMIFLSIYRFVKYPIKKLIDGTRRIERGDYAESVQIDRADEMGQLAKAIRQMGTAIHSKQSELNKQRDQFQNLFEMVPCVITVQDRDYRLIGYNREFADKFAPKPGDYCYCAYKGRTEKCVDCPVEATFADGQSHYSEETGVDKDGSVKHWIVRTSPIRDESGEIVAAMEMNLDISERKQLEEKLELSEKKYHAIFNNIPNPVFVLEIRSLEILDCNKSVHAVYGLERDQLIGTCFLSLFEVEDRETMAFRMATTAVLNQVRQMGADGRPRFVDIRISPSEYTGQRVLLVTISDVTKRLEAEQQLIQASKMATLGEMATGVAHELNQPLSVIKTASNFFMRKLRKKEPIRDDILMTMSAEIDSHVERATRIITHMRQFGRKSDPNLEPVSLNEVLERAFEIFSQQLKVRGIEVDWRMDPELPRIMGNPSRLEQVVINLLINARDAIEENVDPSREAAARRKITLATTSSAKTVTLSVCDTGVGVPEAIRGKIFEPFFTTKKVGKGTGLGLSISYGIVKECGGRIEVSANPEGGTCFNLSFPPAKEAS